MTLGLKLSKFRNVSGAWSGIPIAEAKIYYDPIYSLGKLSSLHNGVWLEPYGENGKIVQEMIQLFNTYDLTHSKAGGFNTFGNGQQGENQYCN